MKTKPMKTSLTLILLSFFFWVNSYAQPATPTVHSTAIGFCAFQTTHEAAQDNPVWYKSFEKTEQSIYQDFTNEGQHEKSLLAPPIYTLPIVIHIIHDNGFENISDAQVLQGIQDLNDAYANIGYYNPDTGVDSEIQFCLANRNPDGNTTTGINRVQSTLTEMVLETDDIAVKDLIRWDPLNYINIWLVREICSTGFGCGVAGYAYFPTSHGQAEDGIMMEAVFFGNSPGESGIQIHEMGHYLGLYHTFKGTCQNNDCLMDGDRVCDTPPDASTAAVPCSGTVNTCSTDSNSGFPDDQNDIFEDYMDYGDINCWSVFTQGQADRMQWHIENVRFSLLDSPGCLDPCLVSPTAIFTANQTSLNVGEQVTLTNTSTNGSIYNWEIDGSTFANTLNATYTFNLEGTFEICLEIGNSDPNCLDTYCENITVTCPIQSEFTTDILYPNIGQVVNFLNSSLNANSYTWQLDGTVISTNTDFQYSFQNPGIYELCLISSNGFCEETFCLPLFVVEQFSDCEGSFLKRLGDPGILERPHTMIELPDGDLLIGGIREDRSLLIKVDAEGNPIWQRTFDMTSGDDFIHRMILDSEGMLLINGRDQINSSTVNFMFRYDYQNDVILWSKQMSNPGFTRIETMLLNPENDHIFLAGLVNNPSTSLDYLIMEMDYQTGDLNWVTSYNTGGSTEVTNGAYIYEDKLYLATNVRLGAGDLSKIRASMSRLDFNGNEEWTRIYFKDFNGSARTYTYDLHIQNDEITALGHGDLNGATVTEYTPQLYKTELDGELIWARNYSFGPNSNSNRVKQLIRLADGYMIEGSHSYFGENQVFYMRVDLNGDPVWAKTISIESAFLNYSSVFYNSLIYFTGKSSEFDASEDIILGSITLDGDIIGPGCLYINELDATVEDINVPYDGTPVIDQEPVNTSLTDAAGSMGEVDIESAFLENCFCENNLECDTTFLNIYGTAFEQESGRALIAVPEALGGGILVGGGKENSASLNYFDPAGNLIWTRNFDIFPGEDDFIVDLKFDSDDILIGVGQTNFLPNASNSTFAFKYDFLANTIIWAHELDVNNTAQERYFSILELSPGGDYLVSGSIDLLSSSSGCDGIMASLDRNSGAFIWQNTWSLGSCETFSRTIYHNNSIYTTGRYNFDGGGNNRMRPGVSQFDLNGNQVWSKLYLEPTTFNDEARLYSNDIIQDNGLIIVGQGDDDGTSTIDNILFLFKTDLSGNLLWTQKYDLPGTTLLRNSRLLNLPDGYLILGYFTDTTQESFVLKTDKDGNVVWSKSFGSDTGDDVAYDFIFHDSQFFITGITNGFGSGSSNDLYLTSLNYDGSIISQDSCDFFFDIEIIGSQYIDPYEGDIDLTNMNQNWGFNLGTSSLSEQFLDNYITCIYPCIDSCALLPEINVIQANAICNPLGLLTSIEVCNEGFFDLPIGTPISIYDADPTVVNANLVQTINSPEGIEANDCTTLEFLFNGVPNTNYYIVINDDGTTPTPFDLSVFDGLEAECDYTNNIDNFQVTFSSPLLDLGPDVSTCAFGVIDLDAGPDFISYNWNNGSSEQNLTAWLPGTYWVEVQDACGFIQTDTIIVTEFSVAPLDLGPDQSLCLGESFTFDVTGFSNYEWNPADYLDCSSCPDATTTPETDITYILTATSSDGCVVLDTISFTLLPAPETTEDFFLCPGDSIEINGAFIFEATEIVSTIEGANGCDSTHTITVSLFPEMIIDVANTPSCGLENDGSITLNVSDGNPPYNYTWSEPGLVGNEVTNLQSGQYIVTVTDEQGCERIEIIDISQSNAPDIELNVLDESCFGFGDGQLAISALGSNFMYSLDGENFQSDSIFTPLEAGSYMLYILDEFDCLFAEDFVIEPATELYLNLPPDTSILLGNTVYIPSQIGSIDSLIYLWSPEFWIDCVYCPSINASPTESTEYFLTIMDEAGCEVVESIFIEVRNERFLYVPNGFSPNGDGVNDVFYPFAGSGVQEILTFKIFDRWGELIFDNGPFLPNDPTHGWDGTFRGQEMGTGVYTYFLEVLYLNGEIDLLKGGVHLIR